VYFIFFGSFLSPIVSLQIKPVAPAARLDYSNPGARPAPRGICSFGDDPSVRIPFYGKQAGIYIESPQRVNPVWP
jgi:hypothetical protein